VYVSMVGAQSKCGLKIIGVVSKYGMVLTSMS